MSVRTPFKNRPHWVIELLVIPVIIGLLLITTDKIYDHLKNDKSIDNSDIETNPTSRSLKVLSNVSGASITLNDKQRGFTLANQPIELSLTAFKDSCMITLNLYGHLDTSVCIRHLSPLENYVYLPMKKIPEPVNKIQQL